ncbi:ISAs1 family transposase [Pseudomonas aeruginosa]
MLRRPKKVGTLKRDGSDKVKRTNEIGMAIPLLDTCEIAGRDLTADALLTQRKLAAYLVARGAHYHFTVKGNQKTLAEAIRLQFAHRDAPDYAEPLQIAHGRIEQRRIGCTTALNDYLDFPHVGQAWLIERECTHKKSGQHSREVVVGVTSRRPEEMTPQQLLAINRGHWSIESVHHIIDWNYDEDRGRIRSGHGPANVARLRRFAIGLLKSFQKPGQSIATMNAPARAPTPPGARLPEADRE